MNTKHIGRGKLYIIDHLPYHNLLNMRADWEPMALYTMDNINQPDPWEKVKELSSGIYHAFRDLESIEDRFYRNGFYSSIKNPVFRQGF